MSFQLMTQKCNSTVIILHNQASFVGRKFRANRSRDDEDGYSYRFTGKRLDMIEILTLIVSHL